MKTIIDYITDLQDQVIWAKDLSIDLMMDDRGMTLEADLIEVVYGLSGVLKKIQRVKEMVLQGEGNGRSEG